MAGHPSQHSPRAAGHEATGHEAVQQAIQGPRPVRPRLRARTMYRLQRLMMPNPFYRWLSVRIESWPWLRKLFTFTERNVKAEIFGCRMCGQCALPVTGYACPMSCPKELRNGPCGGVGADGSCEVHPELRCVWVEAYERAQSQGRLDDMCRLQRPIDQRLWGESSWVNYWQGRDDDLWTDDDGLDVPPILRPPSRETPPGQDTEPGQDHLGHDAAGGVGRTGPRRVPAKAGKP